MLAIELADFLKDLDAALNQAGVRYAVARNSDELPQSFTGNDIDLLIDERHKDRIWELVFSHFGQYVFQTVRKSSSLHFFFKSIRNGISLFLQVDFIFSFRFRGAVFGDTDKILDNRVRRNGLWKLTDLDAMVVVFVSKGIIHLSVPDKYRRRIGDLPQTAFLNRVNHYLGYECVKVEASSNSQDYDRLTFREIRTAHVLRCWTGEFQRSLSFFMKFIMFELRSLHPVTLQKIIVAPHEMLTSETRLDVFKGCATEYRIYCEDSITKFLALYLMPSRKNRAIVIPHLLTERMALLKLSKVTLTPRNTYWLKPAE